MNIEKATAINELNQITPKRKWENEEDFAKYCNNAVLISTTVSAFSTDEEKVDYAKLFLDAIDEYNLTVKEGLKIMAYMSYIDTNFEPDSELHNYKMMKLHEKTLTKVEALNKRWIMNFIFE